jgi:ethanolamine ammonia-lyase large subunit
MSYTYTFGGTRYTFQDLRTLLARATPERTGDQLAGLAAANAQERAAAQYALADLPLATFLNEAVIPYEADNVTRLIIDTHDAAAFAAVSHLTVGGFRGWLLSPQADTATLARLAPGITPEMAAGVSKLMRVQDLISVARKCRVVTRFRNTLGLEGRLSTRLQPNHPTDDPHGVAASIIEGLRYGSGDAVIGINPATDRLDNVVTLLKMMDELRAQHDIPTQTCVLAHVTTTLMAIRQGAPVDLVFQSIGGTQQTNASFGLSLALLDEAHQAALALHRGTLGENVMYFETGQGSALSANAHAGVDQQTCEARAYAVARRYKPLLVNTVVGFIGPEYLYNGKQIIRAGLEDHFCGKLLGLPMGCDVCYTNHAEADQDDMDVLLTLLSAAGCTYVMGVPGADDIMLNYQSTSFHDALYARRTLGLRPAPEFEAWLARMGIDPALPSTATSATPADNALISAERWRQLRQFTPARIGLGRAGDGVPTQEQLAFQAAHALARDAVQSALDVTILETELRAQGFEVLALHSAAADRETYLRRPDLGRTLSDASREALLKAAAGLPEFDVAFVIADGLSASAVQQHALPTLLLVRDALRDMGWRIAPVTVVSEGRVAICDEIGSLLRARIVAILLGERPGLSAPDSLGIYMTYQPRSGLTDEARNCISNIHARGLSYAQAAQTLVYLMQGAVARQLSGVGLKDEAGMLPPCEEA